MRILQVSDSYYPDPGGVSEVLFHLTGALRDHNHEVTILTSRHPDVTGEERGIKRVGKSYRLEANRSEVIWTFSPGLPIEVRDYLKDNTFDIVHTHGCLAPNLPFLALYYSNSVDVSTFHTAFIGFNYYKVAKFVFSGISRKIDGAICVSRKAYTEIKPHFPNLNYRIIPNGVDTERFYPDGEKLSEYRNRTKILFLGRMDPRKGLDVLIQAFPTIKREIPDSILIVAGKGKKPRNIPVEIRDSIVFKGRISKEEVPVYYRSADLYCSPALGGETFGIVLLEAMASGTPVIASRIEGYNEVIPDERMFFTPADSKDLALKTINLLTDDNLREEIKEIGLRTAKKYSWTEVAGRTLDFYRKLISQTS